MKTWHKVALAVAIPGGIAAGALWLAYRWLLRFDNFNRWERRK